MSEAIIEVRTYPGGKNGKLRVFPDRVEVEVPSSFSGGKITAGLLTGGLSLAKTGLGHKRGGMEVIPMRLITSVTTRRDSLTMHSVVVTAAGAAVEARCTKGDAAAVRQAVLSAMAAL